MPFYTILGWGKECNKGKQLTKQSYCYIRKKKLWIQSSYLTSNVTIKGEKHELKCNEKFKFSDHRETSECP